MKGSIIRKDLNEKFGNKYEFLLDDYNKEYDLNKDYIIVGNINHDITKTYKIKNLKYTKTKDKLDKEFQEEIAKSNIKKTSITDLDDLGLDQELKSMLKYIDSTTKLKVKIRQYKKENKENTEFFYQKFANFTYDSLIYDMSHFKPSTVKSNQKVICRKHGEFFTNPIDFFIKKKGCDKCINESEEEKNNNNWKDKFINNRNKKIYNSIQEKEPKKDIKKDIKEENKKLLDDVMNQPSILIENKNNKKISVNSEEAKEFETKNNLKQNIKEKNNNVEKKMYNKKQDLDTLIETSNMNFNKKIKEINKDIYSDKDRKYFYEKVSDLKHGKNKYKMDRFKPNTLREKQEIICCTHGTFKANAEDFLLKGKQCPKCSSSKSSMTETFVREYIKGLGFNINEVEESELIRPYGIDIILEDIKLAIEVNGVKYHSSETRSEVSNKYHQLRKLKMLESKGYSLLNIYDDEIPNDRKEIGWNEFSKFINELMLFNKSFSIEDFKANLMKIENISFYKFKEFMNTSRQKFNPKDTEYKGVFYKNRLVSVFSYNKETRVSHNYHTMINNRFDLELISRKYKDLIFIVKKDSYNAYKMKKYDMLPIAETEPDFCNFSKSTTYKDNYKRQNQRDPNNKNKIYDCGFIKFVF